MGSVTPTVIAGEGYARVEVNWQDFPSTRRALVYRQVAGVRTLLRDGMPSLLSNGIGVCYDHEAPLDVPLTYVSTVSINANGSFEQGVTEWLNTANNGTIGTPEQSYAYYAPDVGSAASLKLTPGVGATSKAVSEFVPATAGTTYTATGRLMVPTYWGGGIGVQIQYYAGTTLLSTVGTLTDVTPYPGAWGFYTASGAAPATTTQMRIVAGITGTPPTTQKLYADEMYVTSSATTATAADVVLPSSGGGWWTDPLHPATKVRLWVDLRTSECLPQSSVVYLGLSERTRPADAVLTEVPDSPYPVATWSRRKSGNRSIGVGTMTEADRDQVESLHESGAPLFLQLPEAYREPDRYGIHGDLAFTLIGQDQRKPYRVVSAPFREVEAPIGPADGTWNTRYMDLDKYATFGAATTAGATWLDGLRGLLTA
jgi:hypothetical protein